MNLSLIDLGEDIICSNIVIYLSPKDIFSLSLVSKTFYKYLDVNEVYHLLYQKSFGKKPTPLNLQLYNWKKIFHLRSNKNAKLYSWGSPPGGRLGYLLNDVPPDHITGSTLSRSVHTPTNIANFNGFIIDDICSGGFCFLILTHAGEIYHTGYSWRKNDGACLPPGPPRMDHRPSPINRTNAVGSRRMLQGVISMPVVRRSEDIEQFPATEPHAMHARRTNVNLTKSPSELNISIPQLDHSQESNSESETKVKRVKESDFITKLELPNDPKFPNRRIISISSGRQHLIAIDNYYNILSWDTGNSSKIGVQLRFPGLQYSYISKISAGWNLSSCYIKGVGIVVWYSRASITKEAHEHSEFVTDANYIIIPGTENQKIIDFIAGCDFVLFIRCDGLLYRFDISANQAMGSDHIVINEPYPVSNFNNWLLSHEASNFNVSFTKLSGCYNSFSVFTSDGMVLLGNKDISSEESTESPVLIPSLQKRGIIHVAMGDYHYLALDDKGDLYSWGIESNNCGCLGLGSKNSFLKSSPSSIVQDLGAYKGMRVLEPALVKKPDDDGKWLVITAAGWHSAGIYLSNSSLKCG